MKQGMCNLWMAGVLAGMAWPSSAWAVLDRSQLPAQVQVEWADNRMEWNGLPMQVQVLHARWPVQQLQAWLQKQLPHLQPVLGSGTAQWQTWSQGRLTTISLNPSLQHRQASRAVLAAVDWSGQHRPAHAYQQLVREWAPRLPQGSRIRQLLRSWDGSQETVWLLADHPLPATEQWPALAAAWTRMGFSIEPGHAAPPAPHLHLGPVFLQAGTQRLVISLVQQPGQATVMLIQHTRPTDNATP